MSENTSIENIKAKLRTFAEERDWVKYHNPKNLVMALSREASELLEIFQWLTFEEAAKLTEEQFASAKEEVADIFLYLIRICDILNIDLIKSAEEKIISNEKKYPKDKVYGNAKKYTAYE